MSQHRRLLTDSEQQKGTTWPSIVTRGNTGVKEKWRFRTGDETASRRFVWRTSPEQVGDFASLFVRRCGDQTAGQSTVECEYKLDRTTMHYLLFYDVVPDYADRRVPFRAAHLAHAQAAVGRGELRLGGALANPVDRAVLLFDAPTAAVVEQFAQNDPYVLNGLVTHWSVREWTTVVGDRALLPSIRE